jgi:DNA-binding NarL/FixJ family response regulator
MCGTIKEIARNQNIKPSTVTFYLTNAYKRRIETRKSKDYIEVFRID